MAKNSIRTRRSFKNEVKIGLVVGDAQLDAHISGRLAHLDATATEARLAQRFDAIENAFATLPEEIELHEAIGDEIERQEMVDELHEPTAPIVSEGPSFRELMLTIDDHDVEMAQRTIAAAIDERAAFERAKKGEGANIERSLKKAREGMALSKGPTRVLIAAEVDAGFVNRTLHDGSRYNVYAIDKVVDVLRALSSDTGEIKNAINRACMISLFRMRKAGLPFTLDVAKGCASDKFLIDAAVRKHLMRHTVSASTAPTQASSTMQALETLGVVKREGTTRNPTFTLLDTPITRELEQRMLKAA